jgi:2-alkyl-3-oxoalkanoate reductase
LLDAVRGRWLLAVGSGRQRISLTAIGNLVQCVRRALATGVERGVFNVADVEPVVLDDALRAILAARGIKAQPLYLPVRLAMPLAVTAEWVAARSGRPPRLTRYAVSHLAMERTLDITAARQVLGYDPAPTSFAGAAQW